MAPARDGERIADVVNVRAGRHGILKEALEEKRGAIRKRYQQEVTRSQGGPVKEDGSCEEKKAGCQLLPLRLLSLYKNCNGSLTRATRIGKRILFAGAKPQAGQKKWSVRTGADQIDAS